jgi:DNA primase
MMINPETIDKIMDAARIEEVVGDFVTLKKRGVNLIGLCPFHNEKTPSFNVNAAKGIFKCFGCGKGGNAVNFIMEHEHFTYPEALKYIAAKYSIEVEEQKPSAEQQQAIDEKESLYNISTFAQKYFEQTLHDNQEGKAIGLTYFQERGFSAETIKKFGLGYCLNQWDEFSRHALKQGYKKEYLLKTSLSKEKDHQLYDTMRGRVIFPIHNLSGRVLGFGARIMGSEKNRPKYINSAESEIYHKSKVLYGLFFAKSAIASQDNCYLVEGYTDVISMHQAGITNVIASSGTSLTTGQIQLIRRYSNNITLLFDGDPAGIKAAFRGIDMILEEGMNVRLVLFPDGEDPDSYARKYRPAEVKDFIEKNSLDFISFKTNLLLGETKNDPIKKAGLIKEISQTIALIPEPISRTMYVQKCSELMQVDEKLLFAEINKIRRKKSLQKSNEQLADQQDFADTPALPQDKIAELKSSTDYQEIDLIRILLQYGDQQITVEAVDEFDHAIEVPVMIANFIIDDLAGEDIVFENTVCQQILDFYKESLLQEKTPSQQTLLYHENQDVRNLVIDLITSPYSLSSNWEKRHQIYVKLETDFLKDLVEEVLYSLKLKIIEKNIEESQNMLRDEQDDEKIIELMMVQRDLKKLRSEFANALSRIVTR